MNVFLKRLIIEHVNTASIGVPIYYRDKFSNMGDVQSSLNKRTFYKEMTSHKNTLSWDKSGLLVAE